MNQDKIIVIKQQKVIDELKSELTYWKETAYHQNREATELERYNKYLKDLYKIGENEKLKSELTYWKETAEYWKEKYFEFNATTNI